MDPPYRYYYTQGREKKEGGLLPGWHLCERDVSVIPSPHHMLNVTVEQIRRFRLHSHHLDRWYERAQVEEIVGGCGMQNSPPGAWQLALSNRVASCTCEWMRSLLEEERTLLQAWSIRGVPLVFPTKESSVFLTPLVAERDERWIYTRGADSALSALGMGMEELLTLVISVMPTLDDVVIETKSRLDEQIAQWVDPLLPPEQRSIWKERSMYDPGGTQRLGEALISFSLRPCSFLSLVVFGRREGEYPTFTSYRTWIGHEAETHSDGGAALVKKFLHSYGPATPRHFTTWLGSSPAQGARLWKKAETAMEAVQVGSQKRYMLCEDVPLIRSSMELERTVHLLSAHDPYLGLYDRETICTDRTHQRLIWRTVSNPGAIVQDGEIVGYWKARTRSGQVDLELVVWEGRHLEYEQMIPLANHVAQSKGSTLGTLVITQ